MMSKLFRLDGQRQNKNEIGPTELKTLRTLATTHNITSVSVPKYRVRGNFVEYVIECSRRNNTWQVFRRYQQFKSLDQKLRQLCPISSPHHCEYGVLPTLAGSHWTEVTNQSVELVEKRRRFLEIYLEQLLVPKNLFYVGRTAVYGFLHDGEMPVRYKTNIIRPLIGFATPETIITIGGEGKIVKNEENEVGNKRKKQEQQENEIQKEEKEKEKGEKWKETQGSKGIIKKKTRVSKNRNNNKDLLSEEVSHNVVKPINSTSTLESSGTSEKSGLYSERSSHIRGNSNNTEIGEDIPSNDETDNEDIRLPPRSPLCLQCNAEFSSILFPHRCFFCKQRFCRNCLNRVELEESEFVKACLQCYENHERHRNKKQIVKGSTPSSPFLPSKSTNSDPIEKLNLDDSNLIRTNVSLRDFELVTTLGRGTFGKVIKVIFREDGKVYAMKVLNKCIIHKRRMIEYIKEEKNILSSLPPHPFIVGCHFAFQTDYHLFFILDYLPGGELYSRIYPKCTISPSNIRLIIAELVLALEHLHHYDIAHRDIKPENIVLASDGHIKLTDFGLARMNISRHRRRSFVGSAEYLAPETIQGEFQTKAVDWWSVGVILYEMIAGEPPFHAENNNEVYNNVLNRNIDVSASCFTPEAASLIQQLLQRQPKQRLTDCERIKAHPYFASINWVALENKNILPPFQLNLHGNDTKYFKREYTAEWAVIPKPLGVSRTTLEVLTSRFSNFVHVNDDEEDYEEEELEENENENENEEANKSLTQEKQKKTKREKSKQPLQGPLKELTNMELNINHINGVWRAIKVEMITDDGKIAYPWGSEVCGILAYFPDGNFTMQIALTQRRQLRHDSIDRATREELAEVYNTYMASFGKYQIKTGSNLIIHSPVGSLFPNLTRNSQKYMFELSKGNQGGDMDMLKISTSPNIIKEDNISARTVLTWERISAY